MIGGVELMNKDYPITVYAYAILLDNKIENWSITKNNKKEVFEFTSYWKMDRLKDYKLQKVCWVCKDSLEYLKVFDELAPNWFKTWKHADDFRLQEAY